MKKLRINNRGGNISIFLAIILSGLISIALLLVYSAREQAIFSCADGIFNLAGDSVMSEYDYYIYRDYGLFLISGTDKELSRKFRAYSAYTLQSIDKAELHKASVSAGRFSTIAISPVKKQIIDYMKSPAGIRSTAIEMRDNKDAPASSASTGMRTLRHGPSIVSLPSRSLPDKSIILSAEKLAENLKKPDLIFRNGTDKYMIDSYILTKFNNNSSSPSGKSGDGATGTSKHFFSSEAEYVICGELSDEKNIKQTDLALKAMRVGLNLQHIYSDPKKTAAVEAAAQTLTPGILGTVTRLGISTVWATAEAVNDVKLLHAGYRVPIIKDSASWAIDLNSLISGYDAEDGMLKPAINKGRSYRDYLRVLLFIKDENVKTARIMDLIQINMRKNYDSDFLIQDCSTGISIDAKVNGKSFLYDKIY